MVDAEDEDGSFFGDTEKDAEARRLLRRLSESAALLTEEEVLESLRVVRDQLRGEGKEDQAELAEAILLAVDPPKVKA